MNTKRYSIPASTLDNGLSIRFVPAKKLFFIFFSSKLIRIDNKNQVGYASKQEASQVAGNLIHSNRYNDGVWTTSMKEAE